MNDHSIIGVVGGVGPYAGLDLTQKIFDQTLEKCVLVCEGAFEVLVKI